MRLNVFLLLALLLLSACGSLHHRNADTKCLPHFPYQDGWMGGDAAYSVPLGKDKSLWLFADSFVRADARISRHGAALIANSLGISDCPSGSPRMQYFWQRSPDPKGFFVKSTDFKLWPKDGFRHDGRLFLFFRKIVALPEGGALGFQETGTLLAEIANPQQPPDRWQIRWHPVIDRETLSPGISAVLKGKFVYLFTERIAPSGERAVVLARISLDDISAIERRITFLQSDGSWRPNGDAPQTAILFTPSVSEFSVRKHQMADGNHSWLAVMTKPEFLSPEIVTRSAPTLEGPWSAPSRLSIMPEMDKGSPDTFCYAAKEHEQYFEQTKQLLMLTYVCNSFSFEKVTANMEIYRPQVIRVPMP